ncbi:hypothetical protein [Natrinema gelatinilyticum]|uniref:hypothetical protein n=1 Tax=Natrinema gelatinilyticum TaxID=2961571 RepID=UPI0020C529BA|nr:hypothetical protein [Natrinema gelatinilyticum]
MTNTNHIPARGIASQNIDELVSAVGEDPDLQPIEKETIIRWGKPDEHVRIFSEEGSIIRRLLRHPLFEEESIRTYTDSSTGWMDATDYSTDRICGVRGSIPIGAIKIQSNSRSNSSHCSVVSKDGLKSP